MFLITKGKWKLELKNLIFVRVNPLLQVGKMFMAWKKWKRRTMNRSNDTLSHGEGEAVAGIKQNCKWKSNEFDDDFTFSRNQSLNQLEMRDESKCGEIVKIFLAEISSASILSASVKICSQVSGELRDQKTSGLLISISKWFEVQLEKRWGREDESRKWSDGFELANELKRWTDCDSKIQERFFFTLLRFVLFFTEDQRWSKTDDRVMHWVQEVSEVLFKWGEGFFIPFVASVSKCIALFLALDGDDEIEDGNVG